MTFSHISWWCDFFLQSDSSQRWVVLKLVTPREKNQEGFALYSKGWLHWPVQNGLKNTPAEGVTARIDRHDVSKGPEYPQGHSRTGGDVAGVVGAAPASKITPRLIP